MIPVISPAAGSRPPFDLVDELRCSFCGRAHRPAPDDAETEAVVQLYDAVILSPDPLGEALESESRGTLLACEDCRAEAVEPGLPSPIGGRILKLTPVDPLQQALAVEPELNDELGDLAFATELSALEQAQLYTVANRLMLRQGRDLTTAHAIVKAAQMEAQLVTRIAADTAARIERQMWWRDNALKAIAARLFPHADAKTKSVRLTYGLIGRKDFKPAPELLDEQAALTACRVSGDYDDCLTLSVATPLDAFRDALEHVLLAFLASHVETDGDSAPYSVEDALAFLVENETASVDLAWGRLKKALSQAVATTGGGGESFPEGVKLTEPSTEFYAKVTEG